MVAIDMNLYFLVEGNKTEYLFYPKLIKHFLPYYSQIYSNEDFSQNNFLVFRGGGNPSVFTKMENALADILDHNKRLPERKIDYFFIVIDSDKYYSYDSAHQSINSRIQKHQSTINEAKIQFVPIIQRECIESWFLGNPYIFPGTIDVELKKFVDYFDVRINDPELLRSPTKDYTHGQYVQQYLQQVGFSNGWIYTKSKIDAVSTDDCIEAILHRGESLNQLHNFVNLIDILKCIEKEKSCC